MTTHAIGPQVTPEEVAELLAASQQAHEYYAKCREQRDDHVREAVSRARAEAEKLYTDSLNELYVKSSAALKAYKSGRIALALTGHGAPYPIGSKLCRWERVVDQEATRLIPKDKYGRPSHMVYKWQFTGEWAVVMVVQNLCDVAEAMQKDVEVGDFVAAPLKKNGERSLKVMKFGGWRGISDQWKPEGVDPNIKEREDRERERLAREKNCTTCGGPKNEAGFCIPCLEKSGL